MPLTHAGFSIPGLHEDFRMGDWAYQSQNMTMFGLNGATALDGGRSQRPIDVPILIHNSYNSSTDLLTALGNLDARIGKVGTLLELDYFSLAAVATIANVQFLGYSAEQRAIPPGGVGWCSLGVLRFLQLGPQ